MFFYIQTDGTLKLLSACRYEMQDLTQTDLE